jgi:hypothetical protein
LVEKEVVLVDDLEKGIKSYSKTFLKWIFG